MSRSTLDANKYLKKFKLLCDNVLEGKSVINKNNMEKLLEFFKDRTNNSSGMLILETPDFVELIYHLIEKMDDASDSFKVFLIKIVTILYDNYGTQKFTKMQEECFQNLFTTICNPESLNCKVPHSIHLECIKLATAQINYELGFIIKSKMWIKIFHPTIHHKPREIAKAAYNFIAKLVWKLNDDNLELELQEVLGHIVKPILSSEYLNVSVLDTKTDNSMADEIFPYISTLVEILIEGDNHALNINKISILLKERFLIDPGLYYMYRTTKNPHLLKLFNACMFRHFLMYYRYLLLNKRADEFCNMLAAFHRNYVIHGIQKRCAFTVVDYVTQSTIIWSNFEKLFGTSLDLPITFERNGETLEFSLQIIVYLTMPMVQYFATDRRKKNIGIDDEVDFYIRKTAKSLTDYIFSSCYVFADLIEEYDDLTRKKVIIYTLKELLRLKGHLSQAQAGTVFQSLFYVLDTFTACDGPDVVVNGNTMDADDLTMLLHLLNAMKMILKEYNILWYENLEIISVQSSLLNLLKQSILTIKHVVQVLDLINICIMKFLSPNMSLLVESKNTQNDTLNEIGKVVKFYIQHEEWELRDSALNILNTCTEISFIKYIPLQKVITTNNLIILATKAALTDPEYYSQCTALKCLVAATKVDVIWQEVLLENANIYLHLLYLLKNHGEGMVRKEAANVLTAAYANQKLSPYFQNSLYEVMQSAALDDLHWEVQLAALNFWKCAIRNHLTYRGMLDGKFPPVTFSKEKRKIIILNQTEIKRQLSAIMNYLSSIGCLTVLLESMDEKQHTEVIDQAYRIANDIIKMLDKYNFDKLEELVDNVNMESVDVPPKCESQSSNMNLYNATNEEERNKVIESILGADQVELITYLCDKYSQMQTDEMDTDLPYLPRRKLITANKFIENLRYNDYPSIINGKKNSKVDYVCTLDQLLDEILDISC